MDKYKKASFYCLIAFLLISVPATFLELPFIHEDRGAYLVGKIIFHLWLVRLCFLIRKDAYNTSQNLEVGAMMMAFTIHGQFFSPWYMFVYHELIIAFSFLFPLPKRVFNVFTIIACALYTGMMLWRFDNIFAWANADSRMDWVISSIAISVVAILAHGFFTTDRNHRETLVRKFGIVGLQTANVIHDVKSMLASPRMNIDLIKKRLSAGAQPHDAQAFALLETVELQLANISTAMTGLNQVVSLQNQTVELLSVRNIVDEVGTTLSLEPRNIELEVNGDHEVHSEKPLFKSLIFNILMNSIEAFRESGQTEPRIKIHCLPSTSNTLCIEISDNGGGYPSDILNSLSGGDDIHHTNAAGMGLFLIKTGMQTLGGKAHFSNSEEGAVVRLHFQSPRLQKKYCFLP